MRFEPSILEANFVLDRGEGPGKAFAGPSEGGRQEQRIWANQRRADPLSQTIGKRQGHFKID